MFHKNLSTKLHCTKPQNILRLMFTAVTISDFVTYSLITSINYTVPDVHILLGFYAV